MEKSDTAPIYPSAPLEMPLTNEQQQNLLPPAPPTYAQATGAAQQTTTTPAANAHHVVVITQPTAGPFGPSPVDMQCPFCHNFIRTRLLYKPNSRTHLIALLLCLLQLYCCICLPYCIGSCMNVNHYCGMCDRYLGTYIRS